RAVSCDPQREDTAGGARNSAVIDLRAVDCAGDGCRHLDGVPHLLQFAAYSGRHGLRDLNRIISLVMEPRRAHRLFYRLAVQDLRRRAESHAEDWAAAGQTEGDVAPGLADDGRADVVERALAGSNRVRQTWARIETAHAVPERESCFGNRDARAERSAM